MKKLSLKNLKLEANDMLQRNQLKTVLGGYGGSGGGTCGYNNAYGWDCNVTKEVAKGEYDNYGGNWCCDSCDTTSYCGAV